MEYTIQKLARLAGVSTRTLRFYDEIGLLSPARINSSGYRIYGMQEVDRLQQILFYRELDLSLERIKEIIGTSEFDGAKVLGEYREKLLIKKEQLEALIRNVDKTIAYWNGEIKMTDNEKFEGFKQNRIDENEKKYGSEIRGKYGNDAVDASNRKVRGMTEAQYAEVTKLETELIEALEAALVTNDPAGELAQKAADLHRQWLCYYWDGYSKEAHAGLAQMYVDDVRFRSYYDKKNPGTAEFLRDAILIYTG